MFPSSFFFFFLIGPLPVPAHFIFSRCPFVFMLGVSVSDVTFCLVGTWNGDVKGCCENRGATSMRRRSRLLFYFCFFVSVLRKFNSSATSQPYMVQNLPAALPCCLNPSAESVSSRPISPFLLFQQMLSYKACVFFGSLFQILPGWIGMV